MTLIYLLAAFRKKMDELNGSIQNSLFNRALRGAYPPGSTC